MFKGHLFSRRALLRALAAAPFGSIAGAKPKAVPIGLELYSVRDELKKDVPGTLKAVATMGYECVEFFASYYEWTPDYAKDVRKQLDDLKLKCYSTHNGMESFSSEGLGKAIELNKILGTHYLVLAHPGNSIKTLDDWKRVVNVLNTANHRMSSEGLHAGYHNHDLEWKPVDGQKPIELIAANTNRNIMLQLDVGTCLEAGSDPVAWIEKNPGRIKSIHLKDWSPEKGYRVLFGEGVAPWKKIFAAAESAGGVEYYLIEQEGSDFPELETAERCLVAYRNLHG
jgi:sugar phosphate isomerase/epimerase